jgi:hypothetical protein
MEKEFVKVVRAYSDRNGITYSAWRQVGVEADVLERAGIVRLRKPPPKPPAAAATPKPSPQAELALDTPAKPAAKKAGTTKKAPAKKPPARAAKKA